MQLSPVVFHRKGMTLAWAARPAVKEPELTPRETQFLHHAFNSHIDAEADWAILCLQQGGVGKAAINQGFLKACQRCCPKLVQELLEKYGAYIYTRDDE